MTAQVDYLAVVFTTTSGAAGELLGSDEKDLLRLVWQLVDVKNKTVKLFSHSFFVYSIYSMSVACYKAGNSDERWRQVKRAVAH